MINTLSKLIGKAGLTNAKGAILASLLLGTMALPFLTPVQTVHADNGRREDSDRGGNPDALLGTWIVQVSIDPTTVPPNSLLSFTALQTYDAGGGFVVSNSGPGAGGPAGQGNWVATGHHQFALTQLRLGFDADSNFTGLNKIRSILTLNRRGDEFTESSQVDIILPIGTVLSFHPAATSHGTRVAIEPLD